MNKFNHLFKKILINLQGKILLNKLNSFLKIKLMKISPKH